MTVEDQILLAVSGAVAVVVLLLVRSGGRDPLIFLAAYFAFFGLGPALNFLLGNPIYLGIAVRQIGAAALGILWALVGIAVVAVAWPLPRRPLSPEALRSTDRMYPVVPTLLVLLIVYPVAMVGMYGPGMFVGTKTDRIAAVGSLHYRYLLVELLAGSLYFIAVRTTAGKRLYWINMILYTGYCLVTAERDFLFVLFTVLLHRQLFRRPMSLRIGLAGGAAVAAAAYLAAQRGGEDTTGALILNQGSIMFTDTFVMTYVPAVVPHQDGGTYVGAILSLVPGWPVPDLAGWLVDLYAPGSSSGYGFSLSAEAFLNFGTIGIPFVFALLAVAQRVLVSRVDRGQLPAYLSLLFTVAWMYGFRGESATLVHLLAYGLALYAVVALLSFRRAVTTTGLEPERTLSRGTVDHRRVVGRNLGPPVVARAAAGALTGPVEPVVAAGPDPVAQPRHARG